MVNRLRGDEGQSTSEFIVVLAALTALGILIMHLMVGPTGRTGAVDSMGAKSAQKITNDQD